MCSIVHCSSSSLHVRGTIIRIASRRTGCNRSDSVHHYHHCTTIAPSTPSLHALRLGTLSWNVTKTQSRTMNVTHANTLFAGTGTERYGNGRRRRLATATNRHATVTNEFRWQVIRDTRTNWREGRLKTRRIQLQAHQSEWSNSSNNQIQGKGNIHACLDPRQKLDDNATNRDTQRDSGRQRKRRVKKSRSVEEKILDQIDMMRSKVEQGAHAIDDNNEIGTLKEAVMANFYHFSSIEEPEKLVEQLKEQCQSNILLGRVLVAPEGINGGLVGAAHSIDRILEWMGQNEQLTGLRWSKSHVAKPGLPDSPFHRLQIRLKKEIITMGVSLHDDNDCETVKSTFGREEPHKRDQEEYRRQSQKEALLFSSLGEHVKPQEWDELIAQDDVTVIDVRNMYEYKCGSFENAINPKTEQFSDFPKFVETNLDPNREKKIAMFCTGGIRCEKASAYMKQRGFENVYQLDGGILNYISSISHEKTSWRGDCFVFDNRVAIPHGNANSASSAASGGARSRVVAVCHGCREPLFAEDVVDKEKYVEGVHCPYCVDTLSTKQLQKRLSRQQNLTVYNQRLGALRKKSFNDNVRRSFSTNGNHLETKDSQLDPK